MRGERKLAGGQSESARTTTTSVQTTVGDARGSCRAASGLQKATT